MIGTRKTTRRRLTSLLGGAVLAAAAVTTAGGPAARAADAATGQEPVSYMPVPNSSSTSSAGPVTAAAVQPGNMTYHGGVVQEEPYVVLDFYGWPATLTATQTAYKNTLVGFYNHVGGSSWLGAETLYGDSSQRIDNLPSLVFGTYNDHNSIATQPTQAQLAASATRAMNYFAVSGLNYQVVVMTPSGHSQAGFGVANTGFCGWHSYTNGTPYAYVPYQLDAPTTCGQSTWGTYAMASIVAGHELAEANTDPFASGWYATAADGGEIGDKCPVGSTAPSSQAMNGSSYVVQALWDNATSSCRFSGAPRSSSLSTTGKDSTGVHTNGGSCSVTYNGSNRATLSGSATAAPASLVKTNTVYCEIDYNPGNGSSTSYSSGTWSGSGSTSVYEGARGTQWLYISVSTTFIDGSTVYSSAIGATF